MGDNLNKVVIVGAGPAGLSAALYCARAGLSPLVLAGDTTGSQLMYTTEVENFPGQKSVQGRELLNKIREQAEFFGASIIPNNLIKITEADKYFRLGLSGGRELITNAVVVATGAKAIWLGLDNEEQFRGKGLSVCATCDGFFFRNKIVTVVGGGDSALGEALVLTKFAKKVNIIHRRDYFRASKIMQNRVFGHNKIQIFWNSSVKKLIGQDRLEAILLDRDGKEERIATDGLFIAIGHRPDTQVFSQMLELDERGYIINTLRAGLMGNLQNYDVNYPFMTSKKGIFACGDCVDCFYRQAAVASGSGVAAALDAQRYLENL